MSSSREGDIPDDALVHSRFDRFNDSGQARHTQFRSVANEIDTRIQYPLTALAQNTNAGEE
jgi:hypothetical protein